MPARNTVILIADDDPQMLRLVARCLEAEGYSVISVRNGQQAQEKTENQEPDLVILDILMPKLNGFDVCQYVRTLSTIPIIVLTVRDQIQDKLRAFEAGADEYITKPFNIAEFLARVRAVLRRSHQVLPEPHWKGSPTRSFGIFTLDFAQSSITLNKRKIPLTSVEFRILAYLLEHAGQAITNDQLQKYVWGEDYGGESHLLSVNINRLRKKIEPDPAQPSYIVTKLGVGYTIPRAMTLPGSTEKEEIEA